MTLIVTFYIRLPFKRGVNISIALFIQIILLFKWTNFVNVVNGPTLTIVPNFLKRRARQGDRQGGFTEALQEILNYSELYARTAADRVDFRR